MRSLYVEQANFAADAVVFVVAHRLGTQQRLPCFALLCPALCSVLFLCFTLLCSALLYSALICSAPSLFSFIHSNTIPPELGRSISGHRTMRERQYVCLCMWCCVPVNIFPMLSLVCYVNNNFPYRFIWRYTWLFSFIMPFFSFHLDTFCSHCLY